MQKEEKEKDEIAQVHYLDKFVDMTTHNLVGGHTREDLQFLSSDDLMYPRHRESNVVPNVGRARISLLLPLVGHTWLLPDGSNLFDRSSWRSYPRCLNAGGSSSDEDSLLYNAHCPLPEIGQ